MSIKTTKTKSKLPKVKKHKNFDLTVNRPEQALQIVDALENLKTDQGWQLLKQIFEGNIAVLEAAILKKLSPDDGITPLKEDECDRLRDKLSYLEELLNKPDEIIETYKPKKEQDIPNYDPYDTIPIRKIGRK